MKKIIFYVYSFLFIFSCISPNNTSHKKEYYEFINENSLLGENRIEAEKSDSSLSSVEYINPTHKKICYSSCDNNIICFDYYYDGRAWYWFSHENQTYTYFYSYNNKVFRFSY